MAASPAARSQRDSLPENAIYQDRGCHVAPKCLACPLAACRHDTPVLVARAQAQAAQLAVLLAAGQTMGEATRALGITRHNGYRLRKKYLREDA